MQGARSYLSTAIKDCNPHFFFDFLFSLPLELFLEGSASLAPAGTTRCSSSASSSSTSSSDISNL
jgi:hypothetical protein